MSTRRITRVAVAVVTAVLASGLTACASTRSTLRLPNLPAQARDTPGDYLIVTLPNAPSASGSSAGSTPRGYDAPSGYVVSDSAQRAVKGLEKDYALTAVAAWPIDALGVHCVVFRRPAARTLDVLLGDLREDPRVRLAQPLQTFSTRGGFNDPYAALQSSLSDLGIEQAQRISRGKGVQIALVDTGVDVDHPDLAGHIASRYNFVDADARAFNADVHGTEMAGVMLAQANNHIGIVGIAPDARLIALKACWQDPSLPHALCNSFTLAQALAVAVGGGAKVVNLSLAGPADPLLAQLVAWGTARGVVFVGATPQSGRAEGFPSGAPGVIAVASSRPGNADAVADTGPASAPLRAPGLQILTLTPGGHYDFASGSSIAAANVSGIVALLLARRALKPVEIRTLLAQSSSVTSGSVNACVALSSLTGRLRCSTTSQTHARESGE